MESVNHCTEGLSTYVSCAVNCMGNGKLVLVQASEDVRGARGIAPQILNLGAI